MAAEQAFHFGMGAEALAADVLDQIGQTAQATPASSQRRSRKVPEQQSSSRSLWPSPGRSPRSRCPSPRRTIPKASRSASCKARSRTCRGASISTIWRTCHPGERQAVEQDPVAAAAVSAPAGLGGTRAQMGRHRARLDRCGRSARAARRRGGCRLHLADSALPDRQLADDEPERADEHARLRRRPLPQDRPLRDGAAYRHGADQHLHRARGRCSKASRTT